MSKHTPGPWTQIGTAVYFPDVKGGFDFYGCPDAEGNAGLCSAAPELLKELETIIDQEQQSSFEQWFVRAEPSGDCDSVQSQWLESSEYEDFCDIWDGPIAAIAKARGETK